MPASRWRLVEQSYFTRSDSPTSEAIEFWLPELRTPELLIEVSRTYPDAALRVEASRAAVGVALRADVDAVAAGLEEEERAERRQDREYWEPVKRELEASQIAALACGSRGA